mgnify:FL=1
MKKLLMSALSAAVVCGCLSLNTSYASYKCDKGENKPVDPEKVFERLDKDKDGKLTEAEFLGKREGEAAEKGKKAFARLDKDANGSLSLEEFKARGAKKKP